MLFNSLEFAIFFPIVVALYFLLPGRGRTLHLLIASCLFYMAFIPAYILILAVTIGIDYIAGIWLERTEGKTRTALLVVSIVTTCAVLFVFKYFHFFVDNFVAAANVFGWNLHEPTLSIILPIGLSFHRFQSLSYVVEVYYRRQKAESDLIRYATYVMFFPQLVAGPIERPQNLLNQLAEYHAFNHERIEMNHADIFLRFRELADRYGATLWDYSGSPISFTKDYFYNSQHLNAAGAAKFLTDFAASLAGSALVTAKHSE